MKMKIKAAAKLFGIPRGTLQNWVKNESGTDRRECNNCKSSWAHHVIKVIQKYDLQDIFMSRFIIRMLTVPHLDEVNCNVYETLAF